MNRTEGAVRTWLNLDKHKVQNQPTAGSQNNFGVTDTALVSLIA